MQYKYNINANINIIQMQYIYIFCMKKFFQKSLHSNHKKPVKKVVMMLLLSL